MTKTRKVPTINGEWTAAGYHEGGHAVAHAVLGVPFRWVKLEPAPWAAGCVEAGALGFKIRRELIGYYPFFPRHDKRELAEMRSHLVIIVAGNAAEKRFCERGGVPFNIGGGKEDYRWATQIAKELVD